MHTTRIVSLAAVLSHQLPTLFSKHSVDQRFRLAHSMGSTRILYGDAHGPIGYAASVSIKAPRRGCCDWLLFGSGDEYTLDAQTGVPALLGVRRGLFRTSYGEHKVAAEGVTLLSFEGRIVAGVRPGRISGDYDLVFATDFGWGDDKDRLGGRRTWADMPTLLSP